MKAMPVSAGSASNKWESEFSPPADAPIPTTKKSLGRGRSREVLGRRRAVPSFPARVSMIMDFNFPSPFVV